MWEGVIGGRCRIELRTVLAVSGKSFLGQSLGGMSQGDHLRNLSEGGTSGENFRGWAKVVPGGEDGRQQFISEEQVPRRCGTAASSLFLVK